MRRCRALALLAALIAVSPMWLWADDRSPIDGADLPVVTHTEDRMTVEMPDGQRLELEIDREPQSLEITRVEHARTALKSVSCDPYTERYAGFAPVDPASHATLGLPPLDSNCDGRPDRPWYISRQLDWHSVDNRLGAVDLTDVRATIIRVRTRGPHASVCTLFAAIDSDGEAVAGWVKERHGEVWGEALVGRHGAGVVSYRLFAPEQEPLSVRILESGAPLTDGALFDRAVVFTAAVDGGNGAPSFDATIDGSPYSLGDSFAVEGTHVIEVTATSGPDSATASAGFTIDLSPPVFDQLEPSDGALLGGAVVTIAGRVSADAIVVTVAGSPATLGSPAGAWRPFTSIPLTLAEGGNTLALHAEDGAGRTTDQNHTLVVDSLPPALAVSSPADGLVTGSQQVTVSGTAVDPHLIGVTVNGAAATVGGGSFSFEMTLAEGVNTIVVAATDSLGHTSQTSLTVTLDSVPPVLTIFESGVAFADGLLLGRPAVITVVADDATAVDLAATIDGQPYMLGSPFVTPGTHVFVVTATDEAGNTASATRSFTIDDDPPLIEDLSPFPGTVIGAPTVHVAGRVSDDAVEVVVNGIAASFTGGGSNWVGWSIPDLPLEQEGLNLLPLRAVDAAGNATEFDISYDRDTLDPQITLTAPVEGLVTRFANLTVAGAVADAHLERVTVNGTEVAAGADGSFSHAVVLAEGPNTVTVVAADVVSHESTEVRTVILDTAPPVISVTHNGQPLSDGFLSNTPVAPVVTAADDSEVTLAIILNGAPFTSGAAVSAEGSYILVATATDAAGNTASLEIGFRLDLTPPAISGLSLVDGAVIANPSPMLSGACDDAVSVEVNGSPAVITAGTFSFAGLTLAEGANQVVVTAADAAGNQRTLTFSVTLDTAPPVITVTAPTEGDLVGAANVLVIGTAADPHLHEVTVAGRKAAVAGSSFQAQVPLAQEGSNVITVTAVDRAGNSAELTVTVERDTTAPVLTVNEPGPSAVLGDGAVTVSGTVSDAHAVTVTVDTRSLTPGADGAFQTVLQLPEGAHAVKVEAVDAAGNRAAVTRNLTIDLSAPELRITAPTAGAVLDIATVTVTGTVSDAHGTERVTVNGVDAVLDGGGGYSLTAFALAEGANTIVARAWDRAGNTGTRSIEVTVDTVPPRVTATVPGNGATGVPRTARPRVKFSEPVDAASLTGNIRLLHDGAVLPVTLSAVGSGAEVDVAPTGGLVDDAEHVLEVSTGVRDRAGHPLEGAVTATFSTLDGTPPQPPMLDPVASPACFSSLIVSGFAEPGAHVHATGDVQPASTTAATDGAFSLNLEPTVGEGAVEIEVTAEDAAGNASQAAYLVVELDCTRPRVTASDWDGDTTIAVRYSEALDETTVAAGQSVTLDGSVGPVTFTVGVTGSTVTLSLVEAPTVEQLPLRLEMTSDITDLGGNAAIPYSQLFAAPGTATFVAGEVFSDADSLELPGARIVLVEDGGPVLGDPPVVTADGRGRFQLPVTGSPVTVRVEADGYLPSWRRTVPIPGAATILFDVRLSPRAAARSVSGATQLEAGAARLTIDGASVPTEGLDVTLTPISEQGLPDLLPLGWRPLAAAHVGVPDSFAFDPPAVLEFRTDVPPGAVIVRYDEAIHAWVAAAFGGTVDVVDAATFALLVPDSDPTAPGAPVVGSVLPSAAAADPGVLTATLRLDPPVILPMEIAQAEVAADPAAIVPSGHPVEARLDEVLHVVDGSVLVTPPTAVDLVLYRQPDDSLAATFGLGASETARRIALDEGVKNISIRSLPAEVRTQDLVGPDGASLLSPDGVGLEVPPGALDRVIGARIAAQPLDALPLTLPPGLEAVAAGDLDLGTSVLSVPATLTFPGAGVADGQYLLLSPVEADGASYWRLIGVGALEGGRIVCGAGQLDGLPAPGVRRTGLYLLARSTGEAWALLGGTVIDIDGDPAAETCLVTATGGLVQLTLGDGVYALAAPAGTVDLEAENLVSRDGGSLTTGVDGGVLNAGLDIALEIVRPRILATSPVDGADRVSAGTPITVDFSEPLALDRESPWGITVVAISSQNQAWEGALELSASGTRLTWTPATNFPPATQILVTVDGNLEDLQGYRLEGGDSTFRFGVERYVGNENVDESKIRLFVPGRDSSQPERAVVEGEEGAVPADIWMFIEDLDHDAPVTTFQATGLGAFATTLAPFDPATRTGVAVGDRLRLHILDSDNPDDELYVVELKPWLTIDGLGAFFNIDGGDFITTEGIGVSAPWGAFPATGTVRATLLDHAQVLPQANWPSFAQARAAARLELTVEAARTLQLIIPGDPPIDASTTMHACMRIDVAGTPHPMLMRTATWDNERQAYVTAPVEEAAAQNAAEALVKAAATGNPDPLLPGIRRTMDLVVLEPKRLPGQKSASAGLNGRLLVTKGTVEGDVQVKAMFLDSAADVVYANSHFAPSDAALVAFDSGGAQKLVAATIAGYAVMGINEILTTGSGATVPLRPDDDFVLKVTDPDTGYTHSERGYPAPGSGDWLDIPPSDAPGYSDRRARIVGGSPVTIFSFEAAVGRTPLTHLLEVQKDNASAKLVCQIPIGALPSGRYVRMINLRTGAVAPSIPQENPTTLSLDAKVGDPVILVLEPLLSSGQQEVVVRFDRSLKGLVNQTMVNLVPGSAATTNAVNLTVDGDVLRITPDPVWETGKRYELQLTKELFSALGSPLEGGQYVGLPLKIAKVASDRPVTPEAAVAEAALENNVLLVAARDDGLLVYDISNPAQPVRRNTVQTVGGMAGVASDGFGNVVTLEGRVGQHVVLRLWSLADLTGGAGSHIDEQQLSPPLTAVGPGDLELEVFVDTVDFTAASPPAGIEVVPEAGGGWASLLVGESLFTANHRVKLVDAITGSIVWSGWAPADGPLSIPNDHEVPLAQPLRLRAHADTLVWAHAAAGPAIAAKLTFGGSGASGFSLGAVGQNADLLSWIRGGQANNACRALGPEDPVYLGRLAATPRRSGENVLLAASRYEGIWGFRQTGSPELSPDWIECVRFGSLGSDLTDIASARVVFAESGLEADHNIVAVVGHRRLEIFEVGSNGDLDKFADGVDLGWNPFRVAIDPVDRLILVRDNASRLAVYALTRPYASPQMVVDMVLPDGAGLGPLVLDPDLGLAITGTSPVQYKPPRLELVSDTDGDGIPEIVEYLQPLGAPAAPPTAGGQRPPYLAWVRARIVGVPDDQNTVAVRVEGLGPGGGVLPDRPEPFLPSSRVITLRRAENLALDDPGRNVFVSDQPILLIADERARTEYWKNVDQTLRTKLTDEDTANARYAICRNCGVDVDDDGRDVDGGLTIPWSDEGAAGTPIELAAASRLRVTFDAKTATGWIKQMLDAGMAPAAEVASLPWMPSPPIGRDPGIEARAAMLPEIELATGALTFGRTDLVLPAPGMDVVLGREYSSAGIRYGLFGWGWELAGLDRLRPNPDGTVDLYASSGDRFVFGNKTGHPGATTRVLTAWGHPGELKKKAGGSWFLLYPDGGYTEFSAEGYPTAIRDRHRLSDATGSELRFTWYADGTLAQISQVNGTFSQVEHPRTLTFSYEDASVSGVVSTVEDSAGREYEYGYDVHGRLAMAHIDEIQLAPSNQFGDVVEHYARAPSVLTEAAPSTLEGGSLIESVTEEAEPENRVLLDPTYDEGDLLHPVTALSIGELDYSIDVAADRQATVIDADGVKEKVTWDDFGRPTTITLGDTQKTDIDYLPSVSGKPVFDVLADVITLPAGGTIEQKWQVEEDASSIRRAWFNLRETRRTRDTEEIARVVTDSNPTALVTAYEYDPVSNQPTVISLPAGAGGQKREWVIGRVRGEPVSVTDPEGRKTTFSIEDPLKRRVSVTDAAGNTTTYWYDDPSAVGQCNPQGSGEVCRVVGPGGTSSDDYTDIIYDEYGNSKRIERPASGPTEGTDFAPKGQRPVEHAVRNPLGWVLQSWVDSSPTRTIPGDQAYFRTDFGFDRGGRVRTEERFSESGVIRVRRDPTEAGLPGLQKVEGGPEEPAVVTSYQYFPASVRVQSVTESPSGRSVSFTYDALGRRETRTVAASPEDLVTIWTYDRADNLPTDIDLPGDDEVALTYDPFGRANGQTDALLRTTVVDLDGGGRAMETETTFDAVVIHHETALYNAADQPTSRTLTHFLYGTGSRVETSTFTYDDPADPRGLLYQVTDAEGRATTFGYDAYGRQAQQVLPDGTTIASTYWGSGLPETTTEDPAGVDFPSYTTWRSYNVAGLVETEVSPSGLETTTLYDRIGRPTLRAAPDGQDTYWTRSPLGTVTLKSQAGRLPVETRLNLDQRRMTYEEQGSGAVFEALFDAAGRVVHQVDGNGVERSLQWKPDGTLDLVTIGSPDQPTATIDYEYDLGNRLQSIAVVPDENLSGTERWPLEVGFEYDDNDNLTHAWDDRGVDVARTVWSTGQVASETLTVGPGQSFTTTVGYDGTFLPESLSYPDGTAVVLGRGDAAGRLSSLTVDGAIVWTQQYAGLRRGAGATGALSTARSYDTEGRPAIVSAALGDSERFRLERGYNDASRFNTQRLRAGFESVSGLTHDPAERAQTWRTDRAGVAGATDVLGWAGPASGRVAREFAGGVDRLASTRQFIDGEELLTVFGISDSTYQLPSAGPWSYGYDAFGNRDEAASNAETRAFRHDWSNRLLEVLATPSPNEPGTSVAAFSYDPLGRRIATVEGDITTFRVPWGDQVIAEYVRGLDGDTTLRKRSYWGDGVDDLLVYDWDSDFFDGPDSRLHPLTDAQGSVQAIATSDGLVVESYIYRPDGTFLIFGLDTTAPELVLARVRPADEAAGREGQTLEMVFSEPVQRGGGTVEVRDGAGEVVAAETKPTADARRWVMTFAEPLVEGGAYTFVLAGFEDFAGNAMAEAVEVGFTAPAEGEDLAIASPAEAAILAVIDGPDGLALIAGAPVDPDSVAGSSLTVVRSGNEVSGTLSMVDAATNPAWDGRVLLWTPDNPAAFLDARYVVTPNIALIDVAGNPLGDQLDTFDFDRHKQGDVVWSKASEVPLLGTSQVGNDRFLHGRPYIGSLGLYDHRARFYEPGTQLFLEPDPLGPVDSPNLYQAFGFDGLNVVDPWGTTGIAETLTLIGFGEGAKALPALGATPAGAAAILTLGFSAYLTHLSTEAINVTADADLAWSRADAQAIELKKRIKERALAIDATDLDTGPEQVLPAQVDSGPETVLPTVIDTSPEIVKATDFDSGPEVFLPEQVDNGPLVNPITSNPVDSTIFRSGVSRKTHEAAVIGQEAHRQIEFDLQLQGYDTEVTMTLEAGLTVRKDALRGSEAVIIKPDTPSGRRAGRKRFSLMLEFGFSPKVVLYDPTDPRYKPGSPEYIGPKKKP